MVRKPVFRNDPVKLNDNQKITKKKIQGLPLTSSLLPDCTLPGVLTPAEG